MEYEVRKPLRIHDQDRADECTSCALSAIAEDSTCEPMDDSWIYENSKGAEFGITPEAAIDAAFRKGVRSLATGAVSFPFKGIRSPLPWIFRFGSMVRMMERGRRSFFCGIRWQPEWDAAPGGVMSEPREWLDLFPHAFKVFGFVEKDGIMYLKVQNSLGTGKGDGGIWYMPREIVNRLDFAYQILS